MDGSPDYLTIKDQLDVGSLSCSMMFQSISAPLQHSIRFFQPPNLQGYNTFHNVSSCYQEPFRVSTFPIRSSRWVRCLFSTGKSIVHEAVMSTRRSFFLTFCSSLSATLACYLSRSLHRFRCLHHTNFLALTRL